MSLLFMHVAVIQPPPPSSGCDAAIRCHGLVDNEEEGRALVTKLARDQTDVRAYIVDDLERWLPVVEPVEGCRMCQAPPPSVFVCVFSIGGAGLASGQVEEIAAPENDDPEQHRNGSVCDMRPTATKPNPSKVREVRTQRSQLDDLMNGPVPAEWTGGAEEYFALRCRYAHLRAFARKLGRISEESAQRCYGIECEIDGLDELHPLYQHTYRDNYLRALKESGIKPETIPFFPHLER